MGRQADANDAAERPGIEAELEERLAPLIEERGYELVEVTYRRERRGWVLRFTVDRPGGGLTVDLAVKLSRELGALIDADPRLDGLLKGPYHLEVSSPGIFRKLKRPRDFERAWGKRVWIQWTDAEGRTVEAAGRLDAYGEGDLVLRTDGDETIEIAADRLLSAKLDPELPFGKA